jgi:hypothetical protein
MDTVPMSTPMTRRKWPDDYGGGEDDHGVRCPKCNCPDTRVQYTRHSIGERNHRRRRCRHCGHEFSTYERVG